MTLDPDVVRTRAFEIEESVARLEQFAGLSVDEFISNQDALDIACYRLLQDLRTFTAAIVAILPPAGDRQGPA